MRYEGLSPRTGWLRWGLAALAIGIVLGITAPGAVRALGDAWATNRAILPWVFERLFAVLAYVAVTLSVAYGLLLSTKLLDRLAHRPITFALHQDLAAIGLGLAGIHGALLGLDRTVPFSLTQILVPGLSLHAPIAVAAGQVALYLMAVIVGSFYARRRIGQRAWRLLHYLTFAAFAGATVHGIAAGTDSSTPWAWWMYVASTMAVVFLLGYRVTMSVAAHVAPAPAPGVRRAAEVSAP